jgi:hypothetical protein
MIDLGFTQITSQTVFTILIVLVILTVFVTFILPTLPNFKRIDLKISRTKSLAGAFVALVFVAGVLVVSTGFIGGLQEFTGIGKEVPEEEVQKVEQFTLVGEISKIDKKANVVTVKQLGTPREIKFSLSDNMPLKNKLTGEDLTADDIFKGQIVEILSKEAVSDKKTLVSTDVDEILLQVDSDAFVFPDINLDSESNLNAPVIGGNE